MPAGLGAFREPRTVPMESCEEASINALDREIKDDYSKVKKYFLNLRTAPQEDSWNHLVGFVNKMCLVPELFVQPESRGVSVTLATGLCPV